MLLVKSTGTSIFSSIADVDYRAFSTISIEVYDWAIVDLNHTNAIVDC
jgi:hypothetical protein